MCYINVQYEKYPLSNVSCNIHLAGFESFPKSWDALFCFQGSSQWGRTYSYSPCSDNMLPIATIGFTGFTDSILMDMQKWYQSAYTNTLIHGILFSKMLGYSIQIYSLQCFSYCISTDICQQQSATQKYMSLAFQVFTSLNITSVPRGLCAVVGWLRVLCQKQQALG